MEQARALKKFRASLMNRKTAQWECIEFCFGIDLLDAQQKLLENLKTKNSKACLGSAMTIQPHGPEGDLLYVITEEV